MHTRWDHHRSQGPDGRFEMAYMHIRTAPSDEDAIDHQVREPAPVCSVQVTPASVDV